MHQKWYKKKIQVQNFVKNHTNFQNCIFALHYLCISFILSFNFSFFFQFSQNAPKVVQKRTSCKKLHKFSKLIFTCSTHKHTCQFQHLSTLREPTGVNSVRFIHCSLRALDFADPSQKIQKMFLFLRGAFPITVSESQSSSESAFLCTSKSLSLVFDFCFVFFISVCFCTIVRFLRREQKEKIQIIRKIFND